MKTPTHEPFTVPDDAVAAADEFVRAISARAGHPMTCVVILGISNGEEHVPDVHVRTNLGDHTDELCALLRIILRDIEPDPKPPTSLRLVKEST